MADSRSIGDLTALGAEPASGDGIIVWDDSARLTKLRAYSSFQADVQASLSGVLGITNALSLLSLQQVNPQYRGYCVRLRRDDDDAEKDFGFADGLLDVASIAAWLDGDDAYVPRWYDQGFNARHATQATAAAQPKFILDAGDGLPEIEFDGDDDYMRTGALGSPTDKVHVLTVCNPGPYVSNGTLLDGDSNNEAGLFWTSATTNGLRATAGGGGTGSTIVITPDEWMQISAYYADEDAYWRMNGSLASAITADPSVSQMTLGARGNLNNFGHVAFREFLAYTAALDSDDEEALESEQMDYWL